jgi:hypothetical protein
MKLEILDKIGIISGDNDQRYDFTKDDLSIVSSVDGRYKGRF